METSDRPDLILIGGDGGFSGVPTYLEQTCTALKDNARITVLSDENRGGYDFVAAMGARHQTIPGLQTSLSPRMWATALRELTAVLRAAPDAAIWAHARMGVLLVRVLMARGALGPDRRIAVTYHGLPFGPGHRPGTGLVALQMERAFLRACPAHELVVLSDAMRRQLIDAAGPTACQKHTLSVLQNCSTLGPLPPEPKADAADRVLVMTGRTGYQKNFAAAARLFAHLPETYRLVLCGAGTDAPQTRAMFARHLSDDGLKRVSFRGPCADIRPVLAQAHGYLLTSRYEGLPIGTLEAFEAGLPVAVSTIPGTAEILDTHPLSLPLSLSDPQADAHALDRLISAYLSRRGDWTADIQARWAATFAFEHWTARMQAYWRDWQTRW